MFVHPRHEIEEHNLSFDRGDDLRDPYGYYYCKMQCALVFKTIATRNRYNYMNIVMNDAYFLVKRKRIIFFHCAMEIL